MKWHPNLKVLCLFLCWSSLFLGCSATSDSWKAEFNQGQFDDWHVEQESWIIENWKDLKAKRKQQILPDPPATTGVSSNATDTLNEVVTLT